VSVFPAKPLAVYTRWDPSLLVTFRVNDLDIEVGSISFEKNILSADKKSIEGILRLGDDYRFVETAFSYSLGAPRWHFDQTNMPSLRLDDGQEFHWRSVSDFLDIFPPIIVLEDGSTVIGGSRFEPRIQLASLPEECIDSSRDWSRCDIFLECEYNDPEDPTVSILPQPGKLSVQNQLEKWLKESASRHTLIVKDHGSGEIADFIEIKPPSSSIRFYHCKACSSGKSPGARIEELKVLEQVLRSVNRIGSNSLLSELHDRAIGTKRPETRMVKGTAEALQKARHAFHANEWKFEVVIVNPGIDCKKSIQRKNTNTLLIACYEWLGAANAQLKIIGT
jgi:hypothetical protein